MQHNIPFYETTEMQKKKRLFGYVFYKNVKLKTFSVGTLYMNKYKNA